MPERRASDRVRFGQGVGVHIMAPDASWRRRCKMEDVSEVGAKLIVDGSLEGLELKEFFLVLSTGGNAQPAHRRCELVWHVGQRIGVRFKKPAKPRKSDRREDAEPEEQEEAAG